MKRKTFTDPRHTTRKLQRRRCALSLCTTYRVSPDLSVGGEAQCMDAVFRNALNKRNGAELLGDECPGRIASFFWIQSMLRDDAERTFLFDLDTAIQRLTVDIPTIRRRCS
jgi:hypothetical protein